MPQAKTPRVLAQLKTGSVFKVVEAHQIADTSLTLDGVYRVATARADHGRAVRICDLGTTRLIGLETLQSGPLVTVPAASAKTIRVYSPTKPSGF